MNSDVGFLQWAMGGISAAGLGLLGLLSNKKMDVSVFKEFKDAYRSDMSDLKASQKNLQDTVQQILKKL